MHCTKISAEFEFGSHGPPAGCATPPQILRFAELQRMTQTVNKGMRAGETSHRTHSTCVQLRRWENQRRLSSCLLWSAIVAEWTTEHYQSSVQRTTLRSSQRVPHPASARRTASLPHVYASGISRDVSTGCRSHQCMICQFCCDKYCLSSVLLCSRFLTWLPLASSPPVFSFWLHCHIIGLSHWDPYTVHRGVTRVVLL